MGRLQYWINMDRKTKYRRTIKGVIQDMYDGQKYSSKHRRSEPPSYTKEEFNVWLLGSTNFTVLYNKWVSSGYIKNVKPSVDRLDDYKPYTLDNIRIVTWEVNHSKSVSDRLEGVNNKVSLAVVQMDLNGKFIECFHSVNHAGRETDVNAPNISAACLGKRLTAGGFKWKYKDEEY